MCRLCRLELVAGPCVLAPPEAAPFAPLHAVCSFIVHDWSPYFKGWLQPLGRWRRLAALHVSASRAWVPWDRHRHKRVRRFRGPGIPGVPGGMSTAS